MQFLTDLFQFRFGFRPVQLFQNTLQVTQFLFTQGDLLRQFLLSGLHPGVILVKLRRVLLGGQDGRNGNRNGLHLLIIKILAHKHRLALDNLMDIGSNDIAQLAQPLPVEGGLQFFFLRSQLSLDPLAEVRDGLAHRLRLLAHGILPVPNGVVHIQQRAKGLRPVAAAVLADGAKSKLLGRSVGERIVIGCRMVHMFPEEQG